MACAGGGAADGGGVADGGVAADGRVGSAESAGSDSGALAGGVAVGWNWSMDPPDALGLVETSPGRVGGVIGIDAGGAGGGVTVIVPETGGNIGSPASR